MAQVLVREVSPDVIDRLKLRAKKNGRSLEAELRVILDSAATETAINFEASVRRIHEMLAGRTFSDSTELIREDRAR